MVICYFFPKARATWSGAGYRFDEESILEKVEEQRGSLSHSNGQGVRPNVRGYECTQGGDHLLQWRPENLSEQRGRLG